MAARQTQSSSPLRVLEEALGMGLTSVGDAGDAADAEAAEGAYYLERILPAWRGLQGPEAGAPSWGRRWRPRPPSCAACGTPGGVSATASPGGHPVNVSF